MASTRSTTSPGVRKSRRATTFLYYSGKDPSAVRYKNWKIYFTMVSDNPAGFIAGVQPYHWAQVVNIKRDPVRDLDWFAVQDAVGHGRSDRFPFYRLCL